MSMEMRRTGIRVVNDHYKCRQMVTHGILYSMLSCFGDQYHYGNSGIGGGISSS